jgi:hypothetical protein
MVVAHLRERQSTQIPYLHKNSHRLLICINFYRRRLAYTGCLDSLGLVRIRVAFLTGRELWKYQKWRHIMAIPPSNHPCWQKLANGALTKIKTQHLGTQLLAKRMEKSTAPVPERAAELHAFFTRWERILPSEISQLTTL